MATLFSIPVYVPDVSSTEVIVGYDVQSSQSTVGQPVFNGTWATIAGSPFALNSNIVDVNPASTMTGTMYRARPVRQVIVNTLPIVLDTPWSRSFTALTTLYDAPFMRFFLPTLREVFLKDEGISQSNGTIAYENTGAGNGLLRPDGVTTSYQLQYIYNDDPIKVLDGFITVTKIPLNGVQVTMNLDEDYVIDSRNGKIIFKVAPLVTDYIRIDFRKIDFLNDDLLRVLASGVDSLSNFGLCGFSTYRQNNLIRLGAGTYNNDITNIICLVGMLNLREGMTEAALRSTLSWRDGGVNEDPYPSRAMEFEVQKITVTTAMIQQRVNAYIRTATQYITRGDFDMMFDMTQLTPFNGKLFRQFAINFGYGGNWLPMWL